MAGTSPAMTVFCFFMAVASVTWVARIREGFAEVGPLDAGWM
jgi:hypothetical protein